MNSSLPELLAPAGTPDAAWAALAHGAGAVYAGLPRFSARAEAGNFSPEQLDELIGYAHHLGRRVYITLNTLVKQGEIGEAMDALALLQDLNADGVIVQDAGIARMIRSCFPALRLHASTQLAVHNLDGARQLASAGFKRIVLARELSLDAIAQISRNCGAETETFIHGALCYSYSGLCLFSSHLLGRSGNRGRCAYCCRQPFDSGGVRSLPFSMKDFTAAAHLQELVRAGVASLKIEGRMKGALYVAAVSDFYRKALDGRLEDPDALLADIQTVFGRPATSLYLKSPDGEPVDPVNDGHRGAQIGMVKALRSGWLIFRSNRALQKHDGLKVEMPGETSAYGFAADAMRLASEPPGSRRFELPADAEVALKLPPDHPELAAGAPVYCSFSQAVRQRYTWTAPRPGQFRQRRPMDLRIVQSPEKILFIASCGEVSSEFQLDGPFELSRQPEKSADALSRCFDKLGDTEWRTGSLRAEGPPVFVPVSALNEARRRIAENLSAQWKLRGRSVPVPPRMPEPERCDRIGWSVKARVFFPLQAIDEFVLEAGLQRPGEIEKARAFYGGRLRLALPAIIREEDAAAFRALIQTCSSGPDGIQKWEAANAGGLHLLAGQVDLTADWPLYTLNAQAALEWRSQGAGRTVLSPEDDRENLRALTAALGAAAIVPVYLHAPLMISATRPAAAGEELTDRSRRRFHVERSGREYVLVDDTPFSLTDRLDELKKCGVCRFRIDLTYGISTPEEAAGIVRRILAGEPVSGHGGNFDRGLR